MLGVHRDTLRQYTDDSLITCEYRVFKPKRVRANSGRQPKKVYRGKEILRFWEQTF